MRKNLLITYSLGTLLVLVGIIGILIGPNLQGSLKPFTSYEELRSFITTSWNSRELEQQFGLSPRFRPEQRQMLSESSSSSSMPLPEYSRTNVQVEGVDEADIVKTDGTYIYVISNQNIIILKAYPPENAEILSKITFQGTVRGVFINQDKLAAFEDAGYYPEFKEYSNSINNMYTQRTNITVYDIADRTNPTITRNMSVEGSYFDSRMIGNYAYVITQQQIYNDGYNVSIPKICIENQTAQVPATQIYRSETSDYFNTYANIVSINLINDNQDPTSKSILIGDASTLYVSENNIYITYATYQYQYGEPRAKIHRIHIDQGQIDYQATGEVPGFVLNQFSMDEYEGHFRIATTKWQSNNVYILNSQLTKVGWLENLALGETLHSARFMGNRCYLVTFKKIDPLFVIDLTDPYDPQVLGELKVTGYSDYLHPYDENHLIGIGKETTDAGTFAWYQGIKISLFDVSNVSAPKEIDKYEIGDRGTDSPILNDHKAFLFDRSRNLLVIPVTEAKIDPAQFPEGEIPPWVFGEFIWNGAYVFNITLTQGLQLKGKITHMDTGDYVNSSNSVQRSLYIDNILYTISNEKIKMNSLIDLSQINEISLGS